MADPGLNGHISAMRRAGLGSREYPGIGAFDIIDVFGNEKDTKDEGVDYTHSASVLKPTAGIDGSIF